MSNKNVEISGVKKFDAPKISAKLDKLFSTYRTRGECETLRAKFSKHVDSGNWRIIATVYNVDLYASAKTSRVYTIWSMTSTSQKFVDETKTKKSTRKIKTFSKEFAQFCAEILDIAIFDAASNDNKSVIVKNSRIVDTKNDDSRVVKIEKKPRELTQAQKSAQEKQKAAAETETMRAARIMLERQNVKA